MATYNDCLHFVMCDRCPNCNPEECEFFIDEKEVAKVVRCSDCKYYRKYLCVRPHGPASVLPNDFCSRGKRKQ